MTERTLALLTEHRDTTRQIAELRTRLRRIEEEIRTEQQDQNFATALTPPSMSGSWLGTSARPTTGNT